MNDQLEKALADVLISTSNTVGEAKDFLLQEIPDVARQALLYYGVQNFIYFLFAVIMFGVLNYKLIKCFKAKENPLLSGTKDEPSVFGIIFLVVYSAGTCVAIGLVNLTWLKIWLAPKLWLIEYANSLIK